jgi:hypothetical protein
MQAERKPPKPAAGNRVFWVDLRTKYLPQHRDVCVVYDTEAATHDALFAVGSIAREQKLDQSKRHQLRQKESAPLLEPLREALKAALDTSLPASATARACNFTLSLRQKLLLFLDYPELELSNNLAENSMRPIAIWRIELGTSWPQGSQTKGRCHPIGDRILPEARNKPTLILCRYLARAGLQVHPVAQPDHPCTIPSIKPLRSFP